MLRHIVLLRLRDDSTTDERDAITAGLRTLPDLVPSIRAYRVAVDAGLAEGNAQVLVEADFDDAAGWADYRDHPRHRQVIDELITPVLASRSALQFEL